MTLTSTWEFIQLWPPRRLIAAISDPVTLEPWRLLMVQAVRIARRRTAIRRDNDHDIHLSERNRADSWPQTFSPGALNAEGLPGR
jgi:hypothetical protein